MISDKFKELRIVDNFYQTSSFFPMPVIAITTLSEDGETNVGPYSLCFPYYVAGKDYYAMLLETRNNSNTAKNILRTKKCTLNFIEHDKKYMKQCVQLGFPGETTKDKMKDCIFTLEKGSNALGPKIITESFQIFECTWDCELDNAQNDKVQDEYLPPFHNFNGITSPMGAHFILKIDKILMKPKYRECILEGVKASNFPKVPVDYGYRDNTNFWISKFKAPYAEGVPKNKGIDINTVKYAAERMDPEIAFTDEACEKLVKVPRIFLKTALNGCIEWARTNNVSLITAENMDTIRDKRSTEKAA
ncbi:MAG: hypothetical protein GY870_13705 [archaeon]|nr:hypothetical protein [archaeon]